MLPLLPILVASAADRHPRGPLALALGTSTAFAVVGTGLATLGRATGVTADGLRLGAAWLMIGFAIVMLVPTLQDRFATGLARLAPAGALGRSEGRGWTGQFGIGCLLGIVWSPCVGPTLGAASGYAAQGRSLGPIALLMLLFGLGAGTPLLLVGLLSRGALARSRRALLRVGDWGRRIVAVGLLVIGVAIVAGGDKAAETWLLDRSPDWLIRLTTRF